MSSYNLSKIDWLEFEELCCDILGEMLGIEVKRGKVGPDGGVDGIVVVNNGLIVLQAKHFVGSGSKALIQKLRAYEVRKAEAMTADRYILMTSCELSPRERAEILNIYHGLIANEEDIFSGADLLALLAQDKYQWIARRHYNLWLSGMEQLERFCGDGTNSKSAAVLESIKEDLSVAVKTEDYEHARARLFNDNVIIITGQAGTGKTILAEQLIADFVFTWNYRFVCSEYDLKGFESQIDRHPDDFMLFFIDDFLGANIMDALRENRDSQIVNLIRRVRRSKNLKLILTSRSYIINEAVDRTVKFSDAKIASLEYRLDEKRLGRLDKARMLISHFHYGDVSREYKQSIVDGENYFKIIDHPNFNPRIISHCFDANRINAVKPSLTNGIAKVLWLLDNPDQIWRDYFESLDALKKYIIIMIYLANSARVLPTEEELTAGFKRMTAMERFADYRTSVFLDVMKCLCSSVVSRTVQNDGTGTYVTYSLFNPSVGDYILGAYNANERMFVDAALSLEQAAVVIQVAYNSSWLRNTNPRYSELCKKITQGVMEAIIHDPCRYNPDFLIKVFNEVSGDSLRAKEWRQLIARKVVKHNLIRKPEVSGEQIIKFLDEIRMSYDELYEEIGVDKSLLDKAIEGTEDCETLLLLGDLYYSIDEDPPDAFYAAFTMHIGYWFDKIADWRNTYEYEDESAVAEDVYQGAVDSLNDHNINPDKFDLDELTAKHDFSQFVKGDDVGSSWRDTRTDSKLKVAQEDAIIRGMFQQEMS